MKISVSIKQQTVTNHELELPVYYKKPFFSTRWEYLGVTSDGEEGKIIVETFGVSDNSYINYVKDFTKPELSTGLVLWLQNPNIIPITQEEYQEAKNRLINTINEH